jgi:hypothetical protein
MPRIEVLETRRQTVEVSGQEILTQDKVTVRVNISAVSEIADATTARAGLKDVNEYLYRALQIAVRQSLGKRTREQVLAEKTDICLQADCQSAFAAPTRSHIRQTWAYSEAHRSPPTNQVYMNGMQQESPEAQTPYFTPGRVHTHSAQAEPEVFPLARVCLLGGRGATLASLREIGHPRHAQSSNRTF